MPQLQEIRPNLWLAEKLSPPIEVRAVLVKGAALAGDPQFKLPRKLDRFYRETQQQNLIVVDGGLAQND